ncbi:putative receptor-like protein kinase [Platanthera guangdongensis]|uniref:Receptor-like protein kinase n=1 Tax=Platanthera guangdongensis TaxID=2320717 RepID=A0ABR2LBH8_9ASPA
MDYEDSGCTTGLKYLHETCSPVGFNAKVRHDDESKHDGVCMLQDMPQLTDRTKLPNIVDPAIRDTMDLKHLKKYINGQGSSGPSSPRDLRRQSSCSNYDHELRQTEEGTDWRPLNIVICKRDAPLDTSDDLLSICKKNLRKRLAKLRVTVVAENRITDLIKGGLQQWPALGDNLFNKRGVTTVASFRGYNSVGKILVSSPVIACICLQEFLDA